MKTVTALALLVAAVAAGRSAAQENPGDPVNVGNNRVPAHPPMVARAPERTIVGDQAALNRLRRNSGITLQWISFEAPARGRVYVTERGGLVHLRGSQRGGGGELALDGDVLSIDARSFTFRGEISIVGTPDATRNCLRDGTYEFRVTGKRRYWRLQQMEQCDGLTDYVDIYY